MGHIFVLISGRVDRPSATETVDPGSIPGWFKSKTVKISAHSFPASTFTKMGQCEASTVCGRQVGRWQLCSEDRKILPLSLVLQLQLQFCFYSWCHW